MTKDQYHHGDLRTALLDAAEDALNSDPSQSPSIRSLAAKLGVSATAPHAHFKTKTDLLVALAERGFHKLRDATIVYGQRADSPDSLLEVLAEAYIEFSVANPGLYKVMFTTGVTLDDHPALFEASRSSYAVTQKAIHEVYPEISIEERDRSALGAWSIVHGLSALLSEDRIPDDIVQDRSPKALARIAAEAVSRKAR